MFELSEYPSKISRSGAFSFMGGKTTTPVVNAPGAMSLATCG